MSQHFLNKCSCGTVISQCRCPAGWSDKLTTNKPTTVIERGCDVCHGTTAEVEYKGEDVWHISNDTGDMTINRGDWELIHRKIHNHYHGED